MDEIKAIETEYNGVMFRSRLEARWALFFDLLSIEWMYEYEGYETSAGWYVPDFWLPDVYMRSQAKGCFVEIKPDNYEPDTHPALEYICEQLQVGGMLIKGFYPYDEFGGENLIQIGLGWDRPMALYSCNHCMQYTFVYPHDDDCPQCGKVNPFGLFGSNMVLGLRDLAVKHRFW